MIVQSIDIYFGLINQKVSQKSSKKESRDGISNNANENADIMAKSKVRDDSDLSKVMAHILLPFISV